MTLLRKGICYVWTNNCPITNDSKQSFIDKLKTLNIVAKFLESSEKSECENDDDRCLMTNLSTQLTKDHSRFSFVVLWIVTSLAEINVHEPRSLPEATFYCANSRCANDGGKHFVRELFEYLRSKKIGTNLNINTPKFLFLNDIRQKDTTDAIVEREEINRKNQNSFIFLCQDKDLHISYHRGVEDADKESIAQMMSRNLSLSFSLPSYLNFDTQNSQINEFCNQIIELQSNEKENRSPLEKMQLPTEQPETRYKEFTRFVLSAIPSMGRRGGDSIDLPDGLNSRTTTKIANCRVRPYCAILNFQTSADEGMKSPERLTQSTNELAEKIAQTFKAYGFVISKPDYNFNYAQLRTHLMKVFRKGCDYSCLVFVIITSTNEDGLKLFCNEGEFSIFGLFGEDLWKEKFRRNLAGKPKFLLIQDCVIYKEADSRPLTRRFALPSWIDNFTLLHCTQIEYRIRGDPIIIGDLMLNRLCDGIERYANAYDLLTVIELVFLSYANNYCTYSKKRCLVRHANLTSTLGERLYLPHIAGSRKSIQEKNDSNIAAPLLCHRRDAFYNLRSGRDFSQYRGQFLLFNFLDSKFDYDCDTTSRLFAEMRQIFETNLNFAYREERHTDLREAMKILDEVSKTPNSNCLLVFVAISDTGKSSDRLLTLEDIEKLIKRFIETPATNLGGRPKLFFVQAYEERSESPPLCPLFVDSVSHDGIDNRISNIIHLPRHADYLLFRSPFKCVDFVETFIGTIRRAAPRYDLVRMLTYVCGRLSRFDNRFDNYRHVPYISSTLTRLIRFDTKSSSSSFSWIEQSLLESYYSTSEYSLLGHCVVLNYTEFEHLPSRVGSAKDVEAIRRTFAGCFRIVEAKNNLTRKQSFEFLKGEAMPRDSDFAFYALFIMTHGTKNRNLHCKDTEMRVDEILECLNNCSVLNGKPRLVFIEACQGDKREVSVLVSEEAGDPAVELNETKSDYAATTSDLLSPNDGDDNRRFYLPDDFILVYSSYPKTISYLNTSEGSWFIQALCSTIDKYFQEYDLLSMLTMVCQDVAYKSEPTSEPQAANIKKQIPFVTSTLRALISFNFGLIKPSCELE